MTSTEFFILLDSCGLIVVATMLYLTEPPMPEPEDLNDMPPLTLEQKVYINLESAIENGYDITTWTAEDIVADLRAFADDLEEYDAEALLPHVISWKLIRGSSP